MEETTPTIAQILDPWLNAYAARRTGRRRDRILAVGDRASACLEAEFDRIATDPERRLIDLERQFGSEKPAGRAIASAALPELLLLLTEERWMPADPQDRKAQIQVLGASRKLDGFGVERLVYVLLLSAHPSSRGRPSA